VSLILAGLIAAGASGAVFVGRWLSKRREPGDAKPKDGETKDAPKTEGDGDAKGDPPTKKPEDEAKKDADPNERKMATKKELAPEETLDGFPCQLGDVVMRLTGEEAWLAGGLVLSEEVPVAALFVAPDAGHDCAIYARPKPRDGLFWLEPLDPGAILVGGEPPTSVEHDGIRYDRVRRLPLRPRRVGHGAPDVGDSVVLAEYASSGSERLLLLKSAMGAKAWRGVELEPTAFEVIASGKNTLE
jgi:hypothetical protein